MSQLLNAYHNKIQGALRFGNNEGGPTICISACTHGGETAGLDVINFLIDDFEIAKKLRKGSIVFLLANIEAYRKYLQSGNFLEARFIDENMNRCATPQNIMHGNSMEAERLREIEPLLSKVDYHIDIHSTTKSPASMAIYTLKSSKFFKNILNVDEHYSGIPDVQVGKPLIDICERNGGTGIGLETGRQSDETAYHTGIDNTIRILKHLEMISNTVATNQQKKQNKIITVTDSIIVKNKKNFLLKKDFSHKEYVSKGALIATENDIPLKAKDDYLIIMPSPLQNLHEEEEYCFLGMEEI